MSVLVNPHARPAAVTPPPDAALAFHRALPDYRPTPLRDLAVPGVARAALKDESDRFGLPAFKVLGASWAVERALRKTPGARMLVAASAGNHGRAVAHVAARRGLACRILLPAGAAPARVAAIRAEGAEVVVTDGGYEAAVAAAAALGREDGVLEIADVGASGPARWVVDGYATLFAELGDERFDAVLVPVGVGSFAAAAARYGAATGARVIGVEPATAACLTASLAAGEPVAVATPGTCMAGMDCAEVSAAAWPDLRAGVHATVTVTDDEARAAMRELAAAGLTVGDCGAAPLAALHALVAERALGLGPASRVLLVATEGATDPDAYRAALAAR